MPVDFALEVNGKRKEIPVRKLPTENSIMDIGAKTVDKIGYIYAASPLWSYKVKFFISDIEAFYQKAPQSLAVTI